MTTWAAIGTASEATTYGTSIPYGRNSIPGYSSSAPVP